MGIDDVVWADEVDVLVGSADLEAPLDDAIAEWLMRERVQMVADVGCGAGGMTVALAARLDDGRVDAIDKEPAALDAAWRRVSDAKLGDAVRLLIGDVDRLALAEGAYDLVWAGSVVHHLPDQRAAIERLARLLVPGGRLALGEGGLELRCLPYDLGIGRPGLEARLAAARAACFDALRSGLPGGAHAPVGWNVLLTEAGLVSPAKRSFLFEAPPPLRGPRSAYLLAHFRALCRRPGLWSRLEPDDTETIRRLLDPGDDAFLAHRHDTFLLTARSVHVARRPP
ncbi:MAG: class I SAM-dependent methyltransferase [Egibacteraceae bacterium]